MKEIETKQNAETESRTDPTEDVIQIIKGQWDKELKRIMKLEQQGVTSKKTLIQ